MKILIAINNLTSVSQLAYANHNQFWFRLGRNFPPDVQFGFCNPRRMSIDRMRNFAGKAAIELNFDYLLFIDDDVLVPFDCVKRLIDADKDIIAGVTFIRGYPYHPMIFDFLAPRLRNDRALTYVDDYKQKADPKTGLLECDAVGFSCCLIKTDVLRKLKPPYFITGKNCTEDVWFCNKAKANIHGCQVWVDTNIETAHILGDEIIEPSNKAARMAYDEALDPTIIERCRREEMKIPIIDPKTVRKVDYEQMIKEEIWGEF